MVGYDDFDTSALRVDLGECKLGGSWSGSGETFAFTVEAHPRFRIDPVVATMPGHDPPVAWHVHDHALARMGIPVIACPSFAPGTKGQIARGAAEYMDPEPIVLDGEPGRRP